MPVHLEFTEVEAGRAAYITMDREAKLNALDWSQLEALRESVRSLGEDDRLRVAVITGAGDRAFTAGADLNVLRQHTSETARAFITLIHEVNSALRQLPVPVICKINGHCIGAGLEVAVSCDMRCRGRYRPVLDARGTGRVAIGHRSCASTASDRLGPDR